jgi:signal transduction histidine kinase
MKPHFTDVLTALDRVREAHQDADAAQQELEAAQRTASEALAEARAALTVASVTVRAAQDELGVALKAAIAASGEHDDLHETVEEVKTLVLQQTAQIARLEQRLADRDGGAR